MTKKGIRYLRYSKDGQSNYSIPYQENATRAWFERNNVTLIDTFIDEGRSARNFDRPDFKKLEDFIKKYSGVVDYVVVCAFDRFSRITGEAMTKIKYYHEQYGAKIASAEQGLIYDSKDAASHTMVGINFLLAESNNIDRTNKILAGINAGSEKGRYLRAAPIGYKNTRDGENKPIIIKDEARAQLIKNIFEWFASGAPLYLIKKDAAEAGLGVTGNSALTRILTNPVYAGFVKVPAYKDKPAHTVKGLHEPLIDQFTWNYVQRKLAGPEKEKTILSDDLPLKGVLHCHCGRLLTGAPSKSHTGAWHYYYKGNCKCQKNNHSAKKLHCQLDELLKNLSLSDALMERFKVIYKEHREKRLSNSKDELTYKTRELLEVKKRRNALEDKWIEDKVSFDTYTRKHTEYNNQIIELEAYIQKLKGTDEKANLIDQVLHMVTDMNFVYQKSSTLNKQKLLNSLFDNRLYYKESIYRTPTLLNMFAHKSLMLKEKNLLILDSIEENNNGIPSGGAGGTAIELFLSVLNEIRIAS